MKKRFGEGEAPTEEECSCWYAAYNAITGGCDGISMQNFKDGEDIMKKIGVKLSFGPLLKASMEKMDKCSPEAQAKMMEFFAAEEMGNKKLMAEGIAEFLMCFRDADANKDGKLNSQEFKVFMQKMMECNKKRFGEYPSLTDSECGEWYKAGNAIDSTYEGISVYDMRIS